MTPAPVEPKRSNQKTVRILSGILAAVLIIVLIVIKSSNSSFTWKSFIISIAGIMLFFGGVIVFYRYFDKGAFSRSESEKAEKLVPAVTTEQARELAEKIVQGRAYGDYMEFSNEYSQQYGKGVKSWIYTYIGEGKYENHTYFVVMNMHHPLEKFTVLTDPRPEEWEFVKNSMADYPEQSPNVKETVRENPLLGTREVIKEVVKEEPEKKDEGKDGDS